MITQKLPYHFAHPLLRARDWQERPERDSLCDWWRERGHGVCALIGIGGAGKTAIVERFLRLLPGVLPIEAGFDKDASLPRPQRMFVFSFYDEANPDSFFTQLAAWLANREASWQPSYEQVLRLLETAGSCLLVLDGLEKVQDDGLRGGTFGQVLDNRLRGLLLRIAENRLPNVSVIITTRFVVEDLQARAGLRYHAIPIDRIAPDACVRLLRQRGVNGADAQLRSIAEDCGCHALTVDLAGGYIGLFGNGDPHRAIDLAIDGPAQGQAPGVDGQRALEIAQQTARFERVALRYREALALTDPAALALLERVCLFRMGVDAEMLALIFTGSDKENISGRLLARLTLDDVRRKLDQLVSMRLLEANRVTSKREQHARQDQLFTHPTVFSRQRSTTYNIHPAVRDGFRQHVDATAARLSHEAARSGLIASLGGLPGRDANPSDPETLDMLEEIVFHTIEAGELGTAWSLYSDMIGGYQNLGWRLGAYERGERICRAFVAGRDPDSAPLPEQMGSGDRAKFINEWALYLSDLGRLSSAARCYRRNIELRQEQQSWKNASIGNQNLADLLILQGKLQAALSVCNEALRQADRSTFCVEHKDCFAYRGHVLGLRGEIKSAKKDFNDARRRQQREEPGASLYRLRGVQHAWLFIRLGEYREARTMLQNNMAIVQRLYGEQSHHVPRCNLLLAQIDRLEGNLVGARAFQEPAHEWAVARDARELLCWSCLESAAIELSDDKRQEAHRAIEEGLWIARDCGFGLFHIDLLLLRARLSLREQNCTAAEDDLRMALEDGYHPSASSGQSPLPAISNDGCGYVWAAVEARFLLAEVSRRQAESSHDSGEREGFFEASRRWQGAGEAGCRSLGIARPRRIC